MCTNSASSMSAPSATRRSCETGPTESTTAPGQRQQFPERFPMQAGKRKSNAARSRNRNDAPPIVGKEVVELDQLPGDADEARSDNAARNEIHHSKQIGRA